MTSGFVPGAVAVQPTGRRGKWLSPPGNVRGCGVARAGWIALPGLRPLP